MYSYNLSLKTANGLKHKLDIFVKVHENRPTTKCLGLELLHGLSIFTVKAKIYGVLYKQSSSIALMKHIVIGLCLKTLYFSAFHWSPRGSLVSIGQHFVATRVVHLPKSTETSLITESDQSGRI